MVIIVVSDTSPIRALAFLEALPLLHSLYQQVLIPPAVAQELARPRRRFAATDLSNYPFIETRNPTDDERINSLCRTLDRGESEAISLALEVKADLLLIDERQGTEAALSLGLRTTGVLGVLIQAKRRGMIGPIGPILNRLVSELGFHISEATRSEVLRLAGE